jgi:uncharacterized protein with PQ loop repeat
MMYVEIIGIFASVLVLVSFLNRKIVVIRCISIVACTVFVVYGILLGALSIWLLNAALILVHIGFLTFGIIRKRKVKHRLSRINMKRIRRSSYKYFSWNKFESAVQDVVDFV